MFLLYFALMLFGLWYLGDKKLGPQFVSWLKYPSLAFILVLAAVDIFFMIETQRLIEVRQFGQDGILYEPDGKPFTIYAHDSEDTGELVTYHLVEYQAIGIITYALPYLALLTVIGYLFQFFYSTYLRVKDG